MEYVAVACRFLVGAVFVAAVVGKLVGPASFDAFVQSVRQLRLLPSGWARTVARAVVVVELAIVVLVAVPLPVSAIAGFGLAAGLSLVFAAAIATALRRGVRAPCRCFGTSTTPLGPAHVARNAFLAGVSVLGAVGSTGATPTWQGAAVAALAGLVLAGLTISLDDLVSLFRPARQPS